MTGPKSPMGNRGHWREEEHGSEPDMARERMIELLNGDLAGE